MNFLRSCLEHLTLYELRFWSSTSWRFSTPSFLFFLFNFFVNPLHTSVYPIYIPLILDEFLKFYCLSLDFARMGTKFPIFFPYGSCIFFFCEERVFTLYNFPYLHLGPPFPLSVLFSLIKPNPQPYRVYYNVSNYFTRKFILKNIWILVFI
jgi:hypothetical protein